ncbi:MAG: efflux RND transporter periplasmic adaptor subunit [Desulfohalobiaceae bacterium]|nr:efflux RND transporter periplasmic adaptor subunit [Desulfohalobiaceae bacterium]
MKTRLKLFILVLLIVLLGLVGAWWLWDRETESKDRLTLYGNIEIRDAQLAFNDQELLKEVLVEEGDRVSPGQVLARLETDRLKATIREAESNVAAREQVLKRLQAGTRPQEIERLRAEVRGADSRVGNARRNYERIRKTTLKGASTEQAMDNAGAEFKAQTALLEAKKQALDLALEGPRREDIAEAKERLRSSRAGLELLKIRLEDATLKAPSPGVIQSRILEPGEMALPSRPVLTLALPDPKWVRAYVPEPDLGLIQEGLPASVVSDSFPDQSFEAWIGFISPVAEFTPKNVETTDLRTKLVYEVRVYVRDPHNRLRLGMPVTVRLDLEGSPAAAPFAKTGSPGAERTAETGS